MRLILLMVVVVLVAMATRAAILRLAKPPASTSQPIGVEKARSEAGSTSAVASRDLGAPAAGLPGVERRVIERPLSRFQRALLEDWERGVRTQSAIQSVVEAAAFEAAVECAAHAIELEYGFRALDVTLQVHASRQRLVAEGIEFTETADGPPLPEELRACLAASLQRPRTHQAEPPVEFLELDFEYALQAALPEVSAE